MTNPTVLVVSLKYSPVHGAHCLALGEPLRPEGYEVRYLVSSALAWTLPDAVRSRVRFLGWSRSAREVAWDSLADRTWRMAELLGFLREARPSAIIFESSHPSNEVVATLARIARPEVRLWMLVHEPHVSSKLAHGLAHAVPIAAHEWALRRVLRHLDGVLLPSEEAVRQLRSSCPDFRGEVLRVPLLFADRAKGAARERRYFSFIGHAVPAKGIETFFELVETSASLGRPWEFQIATSTEISRYLARLSPRARGALEVVAHSKLTDGEIDEAIRSSWAVLAPYRRVTQSGVVPVAFMHGTPVISTREGGMPEVVVPGETGYLVERDAHFGDWEACFRRVRDGFDGLSGRCRGCFLSRFDARLAPSYLRPILDTIDSPDRRPTTAASIAV